VSERVEYDAYGFARHFWPTDIDRNGYTESADADIVKIADGLDALIGDGNYDSNLDINRDGAITDADVSLASAAVGKGPLAPGMISDPDGIGNVVGYDGYVFDVESGLSCVRFRSNDALLGRWLQRDPAEYVEGPNVYAYINGNPHDSNDPFGLYTWEVHSYGTYLAARACGHMTPPQAYALARYTQMPDDYEGFDAVWKALPQLLGPNEDARDIQNWLHSLHGGDDYQVNHRRACLTNMLSDSKLAGWRKGFVIHALGDAYAHTEGPPGDEHAYVTPMGHFWASLFGRSPDEISHNPRKFAAYMHCLCMSLGGDEASWNELRQQFVTDQNGNRIKHPSSKSLADIANSDTGYNKEIQDAADARDGGRSTFVPWNDVPSVSAVKELIKDMKKACDCK
jgi:RHS repeat-associated protein